MNAAPQSILSAKLRTLLSGQKSSRYLGAALVLLLLLAAGLRVPATQRGLFVWDEAQYLFSVQPGVLMIREALGIQDWPRPFLERAPFDKEPVPYWAFTAKPGYDFITLLYGTVAGLTPKSVGLLSLFFGLGTLMVIYRIASSTFGNRVALAGVATLAVSKYHVFYSGSQVPAAMAAFFVVLGVYLYLGTLESEKYVRLMLAGATLAYAFGCHFNVLLYVAIVFACEGLRFVFMTNRRLRDARRFATLSLSFFFVVGLFELFYRVILPTAYGHLSEFRGAYLAQLYYSMGLFRWVVSSGVERFPRLLLDSEGLVVCLLAVLGWSLSCLSSFRDYRKGLLLVLPAVHLSSALVGGITTSPIFSRMAVVILPFIAIWAGVGIIQIADHVGRWVGRAEAAFVSMVGGMAVVIFSGLPGAWQVANLRSGYEEAAQYVLEYGGGQEVSLGAPLEQYYLGSFSANHPLPTSLDALETLRRETGVRLLALNYWVHILEEQRHPLWPLVQALEQQHRPEAVIANPIGAMLLIVADTAMSRQALTQTLSDPHSNEIRIYDLSQLLGNGQAGASIEAELKADAALVEDR